MTSWTSAETDLLKKCRQLGFTVSQIRMEFQKHGFYRTSEGIGNKIQQDKKTQWRRNKKAVERSQTPETYRSSQLPKQEVSIPLSFPTPPESPFKENGLQIVNAEVQQFGNRTIKVFAIFDSHFPHHINMKPMLSFLKDFKPDVFVFGGDNWSMDILSHWNQEFFSSYGMNNVMDAFKYEAERFREHVQEIVRCAGAKKVYYITGNHEDWLNGFCNKFPQIERPTLDKIISGLGITIVPRGGYLKVGKLYFCHGDQFGTSNPAKQGVERTGRNLVMGHFHGFKVWPDYGLDDDGSDKHVGILCPCYSKRSPGYLKGRPTEWLNGFFTATMRSDTGDFAPFVQLVNERGQFFTQAGSSYD